ncbi:MAG: GNAT family N-acetyltransferase [Candidatus Brocadiia bacterium]
MEKAVNNNVIIKPADANELNIIAAMHIDPDITKITEIINSNTGLYRFYRDKIKLFFDSEPQGVLVAKEKDLVLGFIIVSSSGKNPIGGINLLRIFLKGLLIYYGLSKKVFGKMLSSVYAKFIQKIKPPAKTPVLIDIKIWAFIVMKSTRNQDIGFNLVKTSFEYAQNKGAKTMGVTVAQNNSNALALYKKAGFSITGTCAESTGPSYYLTKELI